MIVHNYSKVDKLIIGFDQLLRMWGGTTNTSVQVSPAATIPEVELSAAQRQQSARLMRVNHTGEVCAQALYQGQALSARDISVQEKLQQSAQEEINHLAWCQTRLKELNSHVSYLNPLWYSGSLLIGAVAGIIGDNISLGFLLETERQVVEHLTKHLERIASADKKSQAILQEMRDDEAKHATVALQAGAKELPKVVKLLMRLTSKVMTSIAYWI